MVILLGRDVVIRIDKSLERLIKTYKEKKEKELGIKLSDVKASRIFVKEFYDKNIEDFTRITIGKNKKQKKLRDSLFNL